MDKVRDVNNNAFGQNEVAKKRFANIASDNILNK